MKNPRITLDQIMPRLVELWPWLPAEGICTDVRLECSRLPVQEGAIRA